MKKRSLALIGAIAIVGQTATAQFFTNDLTDAASVALDFNEYISSYSNATWSYTNDYMVTDSGTTNTVLEGGAIIDWVTADDDTARSYLGTIHSNWLGKSWTAHIGMEAPNAERPYYFFGLGNPQPNEAGNRYHEPRMADTVYLKFQTGNRNSKVGVYNDNGTRLYDSGLWRGDPGYDIWMTYNHLNQTIQFDVDDWNGGRYSDIDISSPAISIVGQIGDTNVAHIFFGSNAKVCFRDFDIVEISTDVPPSAPQNVYTVVSNMAVEVKWEAAGGAESYDVKRSLESGTNYVTLATVTNLINTAYVDTTVETNETYYYVVSATNQYGGSENSAEAIGTGLPYDIISDHVSSYGAGSALDQDNLFDNDINTFYDTTSPNPGWVGLDLGTPQQVLQIDFVLRNWNPHAINNGTNGTFEVANSADFSDAVVLHTITTNTLTHPSVNTIVVSDTTPYRYVRAKSRDDKPLFYLAEIDVITSENIQETSSGTPYVWLDTYYDVAGEFGGDYEAADLADTDGDGHESWQEALAGTVPTNAASVLKVESISSSEGNYVISWQSVLGKSYSIITNVNLVNGTPGVAASGIPGEDGETSVTSSIPTTSSMFLEIGLDEE